MLLSNFANNRIYVPTRVKIELREFADLYIFWISGPFGLTKYTLPKKILIHSFRDSLSIRPTFVQTNWKFYNVFNKNIKKNTCKFSGNFITNIFQMIVGSTVGFKKILRLRGVGYRFSMENRVLITDVGFTHLLFKKLYTEMFFKFSRKHTVFRTKSKDLNRISSFICSLRYLKKPDVYRGKGIRFLKENIVYKEGKKKKS